MTRKKEAGMTGKKRGRNKLKYPGKIRGNICIVKQHDSRKSRATTSWRLDTLNPDTFSPELSNYSAQELIRGIGALFRVSPKDPVTGILINGSVLKQAQFRIRNTLTGNDFHIDLDPFSGVGHLMVGLWFIGVFLLLCDEPFTLQYPVE